MLLMSVQSIRQPLNARVIGTPNPKYIFDDP